MGTRDPDYSQLEAMLGRVRPPEPFPEPEGKVVRVSTAWEIVHAIEDAEEHTTVLIAKGRYIMPRDTILNTHYVTICGETGNR